jgi:hypothetical protein
MDSDIVAALRPHLLHLDSFGAAVEGFASAGCLRVLAAVLEEGARAGADAQYARLGPADAVRALVCAPTPRLLDAERLAQVLASPLPIEVFEELFSHAWTLHRRRQVTRLRYVDFVAALVENQGCAATAAGPDRVLDPAAIGRAAMCRVYEDCLAVACDDGDEAPLEAASRVQPASEELIATWAAVSMDVYRWAHPRKEERAVPAPNADAVLAAVACGFARRGLVCALVRLTLIRSCASERGGGPVDAFVVARELALNRQWGPLATFLTCLPRPLPALRRLLPHFAGDMVQTPAQRKLKQACRDAVTANLRRANHDAVAEGIAEDGPAGNGRGDGRARWRTVQVKRAPSVSVVCE